MTKKINQAHIESSKQHPPETNPNFEDTAKQMDALKALIFNTHDNNQAKIQFIKEEISAGRYQIYNQSIAQKLTEHRLLIQEPEMI